MDVQKPNGYIDDSAHSAHMYDPEANGKSATEKVSKVTVHEVGKGMQRRLPQSLQTVLASAW